MKRIETRLPFKGTFGIAAIVGAALTYGVDAFAQGCVFTPTSIDMSLTGTQRMQAGTNQNDCGSDREVEVQAWISGGSTICQTGTLVGSKCVKKKTDGNAVVTIAKEACGFGNGISNHQAWGPYVSVEQGRLTSLFASCPEPCSELGPDYYWNGFECVFAPGSPIIIDTDKRANYDLTSLNEGVMFDIDGDGIVELVAWTKADSTVAFLALDRNGDGTINSGKELFGNHTRPDARNGFQALSLMAAESNGGIFRGSVSSDDPIYARLLLWTDTNHNGISERSELRRASAALSEIGVSYTPTNRQDEFGNVFAYRGWAHLRTANGRNRATSAEDDAIRSIVIWDVYFKVQ